ncbi:hypothetical protein OAH72_00610 [Gammaproteobacteria bacterium]|nr:hypothetical protein [Gammaproteobacteria bacterium]
MNKSIVLYADGSVERGFGHLYRLHNIWSKFFKGKDYKFLYRNVVQKEFYIKMGVVHERFSQAETKINSFTLIVDTKEGDIKFLNDIIHKSKNSIILDSYNVWIKEFDTCVIPSFYYDQDLISSMEKNVRVLAGKKYTVLRKNSQRLNINNIDILVSFGGSDPNDITSRILFYLDKLALKCNVSVIIGPGFKKSLDDFKKDYPRYSYIQAPGNTYQYVQKSKVIITALGTTVQEIEYLHKKGVICFNYQDDQKDFNLIKSFSANRQRWLSLGHFTNLDFKNFNSFLRNKPGDEAHTNNLWGEEWKEISSE